MHKSVQSIKKQRFCVSLILQIIMISSSVFYMYSTFVLCPLKPKAPCRSEQQRSITLITPVVTRPPVVIKFFSYAGYKGRISFFVILVTKIQFYLNYYHFIGTLIENYLIISKSMKRIKLCRIFRSHLTH